MKPEAGVLASHKLWRLQFLNFSKQTLCVLESRFIVLRLPGKVIELEKLIIGTAGIISLFVPGKREVIDIGCDQFCYGIEDFPVTG